ncbi:peroxidase [Porphyromonas crevioricanis]|uniref:Thiol peroxidase n=2 Tax=Porphyromonas crevioricanis TaxID=393921 RepID=A0A0A2FH95_9PORP|nr:thiol peroxidase [Porphyromonas crevioricanis]KGN90431.1 peroxidase [Porphyromonas crevioricanis]KGN96886.1 peroxidase [Porphyromonas crevioricanis]SJZ92375.1 thiol peroxidase, atypical 2-Cys peroxiredoxin [Porphyromonas crevioricanis]SQH73785.1 Thiol peroxidase [Porphyromonas crevioricanis]GAD05945.1 thiol peroxidase, Tpx-type [Porphyromonas crevioricanis JCM 15906]
MATVTFKHEIKVNTSGNLPAVGSLAPHFCGIKGDLSELKLEDLRGKRVVINIFPSLDTGVCAASVRRFNKEASELQNTVVLCISLDLPFAQTRFCAAEGLENVITLSAFRCDCFPKNYGVLMEDGPLKGLLARAVLVLDEEGKVIYNELVPEITQEPNYEAAIAVLK